MHHDVRLFDGATCLATTMGVRAGGMDAAW